MPNACSACSGIGPDVSACGGGEGCRKDLAFAVLERIGDAMAAAIVDGRATAAMLPLAPSKITLAVGQTWVPRTPRARPRTVMWYGKPSFDSLKRDEVCVGYAEDPAAPAFKDVGHDSYVGEVAFLAWIRKKDAVLAPPAAPLLGREEVEEMIGAMERRDIDDELGLPPRAFP